MREDQNGLSITDFLTNCDEQAGNAGNVRLEQTVKICQRIKQFADDDNGLENFLFVGETNTKDREKIFRKLASIMHPDKNPLIEKWQKQLLSDTFVRITTIRCQIERREQRLADELFIKTLSGKCDSIGVIDEQQDDFTIMKKLEQDMFLTLIADGAHLSDRTHKSLVYIYGKVLQYLIYWGAENAKDWLVSSMGLLADHCELLTGHVKRAGAAEVFESALKLNIAMSESSLAQLIGQTIADNKQRTEVKNINNSVNVAAGIVTVGITTSILLLSGPAGWISLAAFFATATVNAAQYGVYRKRDSAKDLDRKKFYQSISEALKLESKMVFTAVRKENEYHKYLQKTQRIVEELVGTMDQHLIEQRDKLLVKASKTEEDNVLLRDMSQCLGGINQKRNHFFTAVEQRSLVSLGIRVEDVHSAQEAAELRKDFLNDALDSEEYALLESLGAEQKLFGLEI